MRKIIVAVLCVVTAAAAAAFAPAVSAENTSNADSTFIVTDFGADGSDNLDDTEAFQAALDIAKNTDTKITVTVPAGTYYVKNRLLIYSNTCLRLDDDAVMRRTNNLDYIIMSGEDSPERQKEKFLSHDITIDGGTWDGTPSTTDESKGVIKVYNSDSVTLSNAKITNVCGTHFVLFDGVSNLTVKNCEFSDFIEYTGTQESYQAQVFANLNYWSAEALHIDFLDKSSTLLNGRPYIPCSDVTVSGCTFKNLTSAIGTHHVFDYMSQNNISIHDNTFYNCTFDCINATSFSNMKIYNNKASDCGGFLVARKSTGEVFSNVASLVKYPADSTYVYGKFGSSEPYFYGVEMTNQCDILFRNNTISGASSHGIYVNTNSDVTIRDNTIANCKGNGISIWGSSTAALNRNTILGSGINGISVKNGAKVNECARNIIKNNANNGIYVYSAALVSSKYNTVSSNGFNGYSFSTSAKGTICSNDISLNKDNGVFLSTGANVTASSNIVRSNKKCAFAVASRSSANIRYNNIYGNAGYDLHVRSGSVNVAFSFNGSDKNTILTDPGCRAAVTSSKSCLRSADFKIPSQMVYTGRQIKPAVISSLKKDTDYTVTYGANVNTGEGTVTVSGRGKYSGVITLRFNIVPKAGAVSRIVPSSSGATVVWKTDQQANGYDVAYSTSSSFSNAQHVYVRSDSLCSAQLNDLVSDKKYYVRVRAYKTINGSACYGGWSAWKSFTAG